MTTDIHLRDIDFERISRFVYEVCGINLHDGKRELVKARLGKRLRQGSFDSFTSYFDYVTTEEGTNELIHMIDSLSTNLTSFFREAKHFEIFKSLLKERVSPNGGPRQKLNIWSAGCSSGEEPYTVAMIVRETLGALADRVSIVATDISTKALKTAASAVYSEDKVKPIPPQLLRKYFQLGSNQWTGYYRLKPSIRDTVRFRRFNLMDKIDFCDSLDIIFCRNVMIYFDKKTQNELIDRFYDVLAGGGYLFVGHSESLTGLDHRFRYIGPSVYTK
ncbi:MAG: protein-glutamate O-methyltransferase [Deltaproteobacteria bacterium]|nr:protein-glutamate O-methyltransferase [Deltaproteobacteria bacterium]